MPPPTNLGTLLDDDIADASGVTIGSYAFAAYQSVYSATVPGLSLDQALTPAGAAATPGMAGLCLLGQHDELHAQALALVGHHLSNDPATTKPWSTLLAHNTPSAPIGVPLYVAPGVDDTLVLPGATKTFVAAQCAAGAHVTFDLLPNNDHGSIALTAIPQVLAFFDGALRGTPPASTC